MSIAHCRCGKTKRFRGQRRHFTCLECRQARQKEQEATAVEITCDGCGRTQCVPARQVKKCRPCDGYMCGAWGCKSDIRWKPQPPIEKLIGWHMRSGWELSGGFYSYNFEQDTVEDIAAQMRACEIRDAGLRMLRGDR
jgi:hypothetical protein